MAKFSFSRIWRALVAAGNTRPPLIREVLGTEFFRTALAGLVIRSEKEQRAHAFDQTKKRGYLIEDENKLEVLTLSRALDRIRRRIGEWDDFRCRKNPLRAEPSDVDHTEILSVNVTVTSSKLKLRPPIAVNWSVSFSVQVVAGKSALIVVDNEGRYGNVDTFYRCGVDAFIRTNDYWTD